MNVGPGSTIELGHAMQWRVGECGPRCRARRLADRDHRPADHDRRDLFDVAGAAAAGPGPAQDLAARVAELEAELARPRADARRHAEEKRMLASETLTRLHCARTAEGRLAARDLVANRHKQAAPSQSDISAMVRP